MHNLSRNFETQRFVSVIWLKRNILSNTIITNVIRPVQRSEEEKEKVKIVAVDLQAMAPLPGVIQIQVGGPSSRQHHGSGTVGSAFFPRPEAAFAFICL